MTDIPFSSVAAPIVKKALEAAAPTIRNGAGKIAKNIIDSVIANLQIGFTPYLQASYERASSVKTLLSQDRPLALLDVYVNLFLTCAEINTTDDDLIGDLQKYRHVVITGLAGCGKSMLLRYLTICHFERHKGTIPIFVEMRRLNTITSKNILAYIHSSCSTAGSNITLDQFTIALRTGGIIIILDGLDVPVHIPPAGASSG